MTGPARSNYPGRLPCAVVDEPLVASPVKVRQLQRALWAAAKQSEGRRFQALFDRIHRVDVPWEAWKRVRNNKGAAGVDRVTLAAVEDYGVDRMLRELRCDLRAGVYRPAPARRVDSRNHAAVRGRWEYRYWRPNGAASPIASGDQGHNRSLSLAPSLETLRRATTNKWAP